MGKHSMPKKRVNVFDTTYMKVAGKAAVTVGAIAVATTPALASIADTEKKESSVTQVASSATLTVVNPDSSKDVYPVTDVSATVGSVLESLGIQAGDYRNESGHEVNTGEKFSDNAHVTIYKYISKDTTKKVKLDAPVVYEDSDSLFVGEEEVKEEGSPGEAIVTSVVSSTSTREGAVTEEKLTVVKHPKNRVILRGTKSVEAQNEQPESSPPSVPRSGGNAHPAGQGVSTYAPSDTTVRKSKSINKDVSLPNGSKAEQVLAIAKQYTGVPYVWGGTSPSGWDCSGYTSFVYRHVGVNLPRTSGAQLRSGKIVSYKDAQPGDIIWSPGHVGIYAGNGMMYDAGNKKVGTSYRSVNWMLRSGAKFVRVL